MFAKNRWRKILEIIRQEKEVVVAELAERFRVTQETIRRDLRKLTAEGRLLRTHGGAVSRYRDIDDAPYSVRETENIMEKKAIVSAAVRHISENDIIFLDSSSTACQLAAVLPDIRITVVTNSMNALQRLALLERTRVISTGGILEPVSMSFEGSSVIEMLERYNPSKLFFSCKGLDMERGLSEATEEHAYIKKRMLELAARRYLLADYSKFGVRSAVFLSDLDCIDCVITDSKTDPDKISKLRERNIEVEITGLEQQ